MRAIVEAVPPVEAIPANPAPPSRTFRLGEIVKSAKGQLLINTIDANTNDPNTWGPGAGLGVFARPFRPALSRRPGLTPVSPPAGRFDPCGGRPLSKHHNALTGHAIAPFLDAPTRAALRAITLNPVVGRYLAIKPRSTPLTF